ncbi:MAG TPA: carboxyl transferase domain-containing protein [Burkholderiaceae bacterium]|jgi:3-methylcrotonyl-CoA carboxylase beta subunit|nr:carboxyl transferase domain-containing protein [Burkholderiaceae bacterium]
MRRIQSSIDTSSASFRRNREHNLELAAQLKARQHAARHERPARDIERLRKAGKLLVRERLDLLLDPGTPFLELSTLAACRAYEGEVPQAAVVSGIGVVSGREVLVLAGDSSVKGGALYPHSVDKIVRALDIALENRLPVVHLVDSAGAYLPLQSTIFPGRHGGGRTFRNQCRLSGEGIAQVAVVLGHCTAGGAYVPTLSDYSIMVRGIGGVFLGGPPLVKAATGEDVNAEELGGADMHTRVSGTADYAVDSEAEGIALAREIVGTFRRTPKAPHDWREPQPPYYDASELYGVIPDDIRKQFDMREVIARLVDGSLFHEFKPDYGSTLVCGYAYLWGYKVGILGNNGVLFSQAANKAAQFMQLCDRDGVPLLFLHNVTGFMIGREYERGGITKDGAKMLMVQANVRVPKLAVCVHASNGAGHYAMTSAAWDPRFLFTWPNSRVSVMGAQQAAKTLAQIKVAALRREGREPGPDELAAIERQIFDEYESTSDCYYGTSEMWDDGVLDPLDTRNALGIALGVALNNVPDAVRRGVLRI